MSSHPRVVAILIRAVLTEGVRVFLNEFSSKGVFFFIEACSHPRGVAILMKGVLTKGVCVGF